VGFGSILKAIREYKEHINVGFQVDGRRFSQILDEKPILVDTR
jgi:hypothetical protein